MKQRYAIAVFLSIFLFAVISSTLGALQDRYIAYYGLTNAQQGLPASLLNIGSIAALITSLWVMGRVAKPHLVWISSAVTVLLLLPLGAPPAFAAFSMMFLLMGVSVGYTDTLASSVIADLYTGKRAAMLMCVLHATFGTAGIVSPIAFRSMMNAGIPWHRLYAVLAALGGVMLVYMIPVCLAQLRAARTRPAGNGQSATGQKLTIAESKRFLKDRDSVMLLLGMFAYGMFLSSISIWIQRFVGVELGNEALGAPALSLFWLGLTASRLISPLIRVRPVALIRVSSFAAAVLIAVGIALGDAAFMCAAGALTGLISGATIPLLMHEACSRYSHNTLMATTFLLLSVYVAQSVFPPVVGAAASAFGLTAAMYVCPAALLLCGGAAMMIKTKQ